MPARTTHDLARTRTRQRDRPPDRLDRLARADGLRLTRSLAPGGRLRAASLSPACVLLLVLSRSAGPPRPAGTPGPRRRADRRARPAASCRSRSRHRRRRSPSSNAQQRGLASRHRRRRAGQLSRHQRGPRRRSRRRSTMADRDRRRKAPTRTCVDELADARRPAPRLEPGAVKAERAAPAQGPARGSHPQRLRHRPDVAARVVPVERVVHGHARPRSATTSTSATRTRRSPSRSSTTRRRRVAPPDRRWPPGARPNDLRSRPPPRSGSSTRASRT